jgi:hypothetical protein
MANGPSLPMNMPDHAAGSCRYALKNQPAQEIHRRKLMIESEKCASAGTLVLPADGSDGPKSYPGLLAEGSGLPLQSRSA